MDHRAEALERASSFYREGRFSEAQALCEDVLQSDPENFGALTLLGAIMLRSARPQRAAEFFDKAGRLRPNHASAHYNLGGALIALGRYEEALASYGRAVAADPSFSEAHNDRGNALSILRRFDGALESYDKAIALKPDFAIAHCNRGNALGALGRCEDALESYEKAIELDPRFVPAYYNRANALSSLKRYVDSLASYDMAIARDPRHAEAFNNRGNVLRELGRDEEALESYLGALALRPDYADALNNYANVLKASGQHAEARIAYGKAIASRPDFDKPHNNLGNLLRDLERHEEALASYDKAIARNPNFTEAYYNRGNVLSNLSRPVEALASYEKVLALDPDFPFALGSLVHAKTKLCRWQGLRAEIAELVLKVQSGKTASLPFAMLAITDSPELQKSAAETYVRHKLSDNPLPPPATKRGRQDVIRVGYFSCDFHSHATAVLLAELIEKHDRTRVSPIAFSFGPDRNDPMRQRLKAAFDEFVDIRGHSDKDAARVARAREIDIAVDLKGYTEGARENIFVRRAAPVQVGYLGYPGTMGSGFMDYLIADSTLIAETARKYYAEKIIYLPHSYQANDTKRLIADRAFARAGIGLPDKAFVFCCFNNNYKIMPEMFDCWMRILGRVERSVLWLFAEHPEVAANLRNEARMRGVDSSRLIFAGRLPLPDHLARHRLADLFLDTAPCNAHTTASDALWAGLPLITQIGETFAGRVAASLLNAVDLSELVTSTPAGYEDLAVDLATNPGKLAAIREKLVRARLSAPLFDIGLFTTHIEAAYAAICERNRAGLPPEHIVVPATP